MKGVQYRRVEICREFRPAGFRRFLDVEYVYEAIIWRVKLKTGLEGNLFIYVLLMCLFFTDTYSANVVGRFET